MRIKTLLNATAVALLAGCNSISTACTLIGCDDGLSVQFSQSPTDGYRVEAWSELNTAPQVLECGAGQVCPPVVFPDFQGENVTIRVTTEAGSQVHEFVGVEYLDLYPNGRRCGATCRQATVTIQL